MRSVAHVSLPAWHPRWADCPFYENACRHLATHSELIVADDGNGGEMEIDLNHWRFAMAAARVIKVEQGQLDAVQAAVIQEGDPEPDLHMPFDSTFIELTHPDPRYAVRGVLIATSAVGDVGYAVLPFVSVSERRTDVACSGMGWWAGNENKTVPFAHPGGRSFHSFQQYLADTISDGLDMAVALDYLLKSSNVTTTEAAVSRQVRRAAARKGEEIPLVVEVRSSRTKSEPRGGTADYSHRFEVRAHFQHHSKGPIFDRCKDPRKRVVVNGVECVRVWNPGSIKGPEDKPFIPKVRDATHLQEAA